MTGPAPAPRPRLLDLFCGAGGAAMGYHRAGFDVVGVDIRPQPNYPFPFAQGDALEALKHMDGVWLSMWGDVTLRFDAIHASPPCQFASRMTRITGGEHVNLIPATRELLDATGLPYVIENVEDAREHMRDPVLICGSMFDPPMEVKRHRLFETNWPLTDPVWPCRHRVWYPRYPVNLSHERRGTRKPLASVIQVQGSSGTMTGNGSELRKRAMGMDWATSAEIAQAIPPAYTEFIGHQLSAHIAAVPAPLTAGDGEESHARSAPSPRPKSPAVSGDRNEDT